MQQDILGGYEQRRRRSSSLSQSSRNLRSQNLRPGTWKNLPEKVKIMQIVSIMYALFFLSWYTYNELRVKLPGVRRFYPKISQGNQANWNIFNPFSKSKEKGSKKYVEPDFEPTVKEDEFVISPKEEIQKKAYLDADKQWEVPDFNREVTQMLKEQMEFYGKSPEDLKKKVNFDHVFGPDFDHQQEAVENKIRTVANPQFLDEVKKNINDYIASNDAYNNLRKKASSFQKEFGNQVDKHKECTDNILDLQKDVGDDVKNQANEDKKTEGIKKENDKLNDELKDVMNKADKAKKETQKKLDKINAQINDIETSLNNESGVKKDIQRRGDDNERLEKDNNKYDLKIATQEKIILDARDKLKELNRKKQELSPNMANHQLDVLEKQLKVQVHNREVQLLLEAQIKDRELSVNRYIEMLKSKFDVEKELTNLIKEIEESQQMDNVEIDVEITGLIRLEVDKQHWQEVMKSYLLLKKKAYLYGKMNFTVKIKEIEGKIAALKSQLLEIEDDIKMIDLKVKKQEDIIKIAERDINIYTEEKGKINDIISNNKEYISQKDQLINNAKPLLKKFHNERKDLKNKQDDENYKLDSQIELAQKELDRSNERLKKARAFSKDKKKNTNGRIGKLNEDINACKGIEAEMKNYLEEYERMSVRLLADKQNLSDLKQRVNSNVKVVQDL